MPLESPQMPSSQDTELRRFLLGTASQAESEAFALRILASAGDGSEDSGHSVLEALADEDDLFDEYVRGELDDDASRRFEEFVLAHPGGRQRVAFARALADRARKEAERDVTATTPAPATGRTERAPTDVDGEGDSLLRRFLSGFQAPAARPAWLLCLLLLAVAVAQTYRLAQLENPAPDAHIADADESTAPLTASPEEAEPTSTAPSLDVADLREELETQAIEIEVLRAQLDNARDSARSTEPPAGPKVVSMLLAATVRGSEDQTPTQDVPTEADEVELQVDLSSGPSIEVARVRLLDAMRFPVWGNPRVQPEGDPGYQGLRVRVPATVFDSEGRHTLVVEAAEDDGSWSELGRYEFRVARP